MFGDRHPPNITGERLKMTLLQDFIDCRTTIVNYCLNLVYHPLKHV